MSAITEAAERLASIDQSEKESRQLLAVVMWKLRRDGTHPDGITITREELAAYLKEAERLETMLMTNYRGDFALEVRNVKLSKELLA